MTTYPQLVIEYVLEGQQRGYNFTSPTKAYSDEILKFIWRNAMPRGQGWSAYVGVESLKCFRLPHERFAVSQVTVTDQQDESGRRGIRRAAIDVFSSYDYQIFLKRRYFDLPTTLQHDADVNLDAWRKTRQFEGQTGKIKRAKQVIFAHPYTTAADWRVVEAVLLKLAISPVWSPALRILETPFTLTTLALDPREESPFVALPTDKAKTFGELPTIYVI